MQDISRLEKNYPHCPIFTPELLIIKINLIKHVLSGEDPWDSNETPIK